MNERVGSMKRPTTLDLTVKRLILRVQETRHPVNVMSRESRSGLVLGLRLRAGVDHCSIHSPLVPILPGLRSLGQRRVTPSFAVYHFAEAYTASSELKIQT